MGFVDVSFDNIPNAVTSFSDLNIPVPSSPKLVQTGPNSYQYTVDTPYTFVPADSYTININAYDTTLPTPNLIATTTYAYTPYSVTYNANGGSGSVPATFNGATGDTVNVNFNPPQPTLTGYTLLGWNTLANGLGTSYRNTGPPYNSFFILGATNVTLFAEWGLPVTYDASGGSGSVPATVSYVPGSTVTVEFSPLPTYSGFIFKGWVDASSSALYSPPSASFTMPTYPVTLQASWAPTYTVTYDASGGTGSVPVDSGNYEAGTTVNVLFSQKPDLSGSQFTGWTWTEDATIFRETGPTTLTMPANNTTLYAYYLPRLAAPTGLTATAGNAQVDLSWNSVGGAIGYTISYDSGGPATLVNVGASPYTLTGLTNGVTYNFAVLAVGDHVVDGDSLLSSPVVTATPLAPPALPTPTGLTATAGDTQVDLSWNPVGSAVSYTITYDSGGPGTIVSGISSSPYTVTGLTNGTTYNFAILAVGDGISYSDSPLSSPTVPATPFAPGPAPICFLGNAPVLTPGGWRRIDSLAVGDLVRTADGRDVAVQRVKHQRIERPSAAVNPYVIPAGSLGATENLLISPQHCVAVPGRGMVEARRLGLRQMPMRTAFDYYNLELPEWDNMIVAGVEVESLATKKQVVMSKEDFARFVSMLPAEKRAILGRQMAVLADGRVVIQTTRKERRTSGRT